MLHAGADGSARVAESDQGGDAPALAIVACGGPADGV